MHYHIGPRCSCCHYCFNECPVKAIKFVGTSYEIDESKCIQCGKCAQVCPTGVCYDLDQKNNPVPHNPIVVDAEIVVLGAGGSGLVAAVRAAQLTGKKVVILEKSKKHGGCTNLGHGFFPYWSKWHEEAGCEDTRDQVVEMSYERSQGHFDKDLLKKFDVVINVGDADTAQSGGENWIDETIITAVREFVYNGGGFIGVGEPAAHQWQGRFIQLDDVLGVEEEHGFNLNTDKYNWEEHRDHFILKDAEGEVDFGEGKKNIYALPETEILIQKDQEVQMAVKTFGKGRGVYISGLPYSFKNSRVLYRAVLWSASAEEELHCWYSTNYNVEVHAYVKNGKYCVVNNTYEPQDTVVYRGDGSSFRLHMEANEIKWYQI